MCGVKVRGNKLCVLAFETTFLARRSGALAFETSFLQEARRVGL